MGSLDEDPVFELVEDTTNQSAAIANSRSGPQDESTAERAKADRGTETEASLDAQDGTDRV
jgi:hypothetical protein